MRRLSVLLVLLASACTENQTPPPDHLPYGDGGTLPPLTCVPNLDGQIAASELQAALGVPANYLVSPAGEERPVDLAGTVDAAGHRLWDWSAYAESDRRLTLTASVVTDKWYAASFPTGQFTTALDAAQTLQAVYRQDAEQMLLLGIASTEPAPPEGKTLIVYDPPVVLYRFPLAVGASWVSVGNVANATIRGLPYAARDTYEVSIDAAGRMELPDLGFAQALRVRTKVTTAPAAGQSVTRWQVSFLFECFGEIARATSRDNEQNADFTTAAEVRRFGLTQ
ncbi:MAG TPA: hypothetical protein VGQ83_20115 [Polyangia bacterium]|jgi:hypothetical protein